LTAEGSRAYYIVVRRGEGTKGDSPPAKRKKDTMANTQFNVTRKAAILNALAAFKDADITFEDDTIAVLENMAAKLVTTPKAKGESAAHKQNAQLLTDNLDLIAATEDKGITAREFANCAAEGFPVNTEGKRSVNKATAVLRQGVNEGILRAIMSEKKSQPMRYAVNA
jgi:hypothetical protein